MILAVSRNHRPQKAGGFIIYNNRLYLNLMDSRHENINDAASNCAEDA